MLPSCLPHGVCLAWGCVTAASSIHDRTKPWARTKTACRSVRFRGAETEEDRYEALGILFLEQCMARVEKFANH